jgi:glycosyltransferase involved in cell wall biosynthesis
LHALTKELDLTQSVIYTGFQSNPQLYLAIIDIFLLPSLSEGTSMTLLEAMSYSKPSIATSVGGTPEIITHDSTGILIDNEDEQGLVRAIDKLVKDPSMREQFGRSARQEYEKHFTIESMSEQYQKLYRSLI